MDTNFVLWRTVIVQNACALDAFSGIDDYYELYDGVSRAKNFPANARFTMDPDSPNDTMLVDNLYNTDRLIVASAAVKALLEQSKVPSVEYLPIAIIDHKGKVAAEYYIVHPIEPVDCIDFNQSIVEWGLIDPDTIDAVEKLVIDETKIPPGRMLFRAKGFPDVTFVHRELASVIDQHKFTGIGWRELSDYPPK